MCGGGGLACPMGAPLCGERGGAHPRESSTEAGEGGGGAGCSLELHSNHSRRNRCHGSSSEGDRRGQQVSELPLSLFHDKSTKLIA